MRPTSKPQILPDEVYRQRFGIPTPPSSFVPVDLQEGMIEHTVIPVCPACQYQGDPVDGCCFMCSTPMGDSR